MDDLTAKLDELERLHGTFRRLEDAFHERIEDGPPGILRSEACQAARTAHEALCEAVVPALPALLAAARERGRLAAWWRWHPFDDGFPPAGLSHSQCHATEAWFPHDPPPAGWQPPKETTTDDAT